MGFEEGGEKNLPAPSFCMIFAYGKTNCERALGRRPNLSSYLSDVADTNTALSWRRTYERENLFSDSGGDCRLSVVTSSLPQSPMSGGSQLISGVSAKNGAQVVAGKVDGSVYFGDSESEYFSRLALNAVERQKADRQLVVRQPAQPFAVRC
jgi:hypothetical protein